MEETWDPYRRVFHESSSALVLLDEQGYVLDSSESFRLTFEAISGRELSSMKESLVEFLRDRDAFRFAYHFARLAAGSTRSASLETSFRTSSGDTRWLKIRAWAIPEVADAPPGNRGPYVACAFEDETEQRLEERRLLTAKESAEKATETKSQFLANMSHEIRTPIQTIIGMTELMQDTKLDREQEEYARQVKFSADVLLSLINDILDYSKIEAGQLQLERVDFEPEKTVEQAVDLITLEAHKKGLEITVDVASDVPALIRGDSGRLRQICVNLVKNAVKFTKEGGIVVSVRRTELDGKEAIYIAVADTGIGVPAEVRPRLFTTFYQGDPSTTRRFGGTGLGLAISRHLVQLMGGEIGMSPNENGGSVFHFTIPAERSEFSLPRVIPRIDSDARLMVVDDRNESRRVIVSYLLSFGYSHIEEAASGQEAIRKLDTAAAAGRPYAICFIDMIMPGMDGWRLAAEINRDRSVNAARLVLMVPQGLLGADAKMTLLQWFNAYVNKPIKRRELADAIAATVEGPIDLEGAAVADVSVSEQAAAPGKVPGRTAGIAPVYATGSSEEFAFTDNRIKSPITETEASLSLPTVLVVEDHPVNQKLFAIVLEKLGYNPIIASDGIEAIEAVAKADFRIIFMDIQMPRMNGYEATVRLREGGFKRPIIAVTASALSDERERCTQAGMNDILVKPFKRPEIEKVLATWYPKDALPGSGAGQAAGEPVEEVLEELEAGIDELVSVEEPEDLEELEELEELDELADTGSPESPAMEIPEEAPQQFAIDEAELMDNFLGKKEIVQSLLARFIDRTGAQINLMPALLAENAWDKLRIEAHTIKGSALNLAAKELGGNAALIEAAAKEKDRAAAEAGLATLPDAFSRFTLAARSIIGDAP